MTTIRRSDEIYHNAHEYHLIELGSVFKGWILFELAIAREGAMVNVHTSAKDKKVVNNLLTKFKKYGFEGSEFIKPVDKELVRWKIIEKHNSVKEFDEKVVKIIDDFLENHPFSEPYNGVGSENNDIDMDFGDLEEDNVLLIRTNSLRDLTRCSLAEIQLLQYATISCAGGTLWTTMVEFIFGSNGVQAEFIFLDALCMNHSSKELVYKIKVMEKRSKIFEHSKEHHIIEPSCLLYSETWYDLSFIDRRQRPTFHSSADDAVADQKL
eukprot:gene62039-biopygen40581